MCNCVTEVESKMLAFQQEQHPDRKYDGDISPYVGTGIKHGKVLIASQIVLAHKMYLKYSFTKKNGEQSKIKTHTFWMHPNYCCFCGEKIDYGSKGE